MAIKIRCTSCSKKISVDDAFAGGMCRCPYCTETVSVPDKRSRGKGKGGRPDSPNSRPDAPPVEPVVPVEPTESVAAPAPAPATVKSTPAAPAAHQIPVANPVRTQWVLLVVLLAVMSGAGVKKGVHLKGQVRQVDVAPTISYLLGFDVPRDAEGGVVYEALEDPNWHLTEIKRLMAACE